MLETARLRNARNFSGGPGALPESVLQQLHESMLCVPEVGMSVLGISHRSDWFAAVVAEAERNVRALLNLPDGFHVLFLQGGATQQFFTLPMALARPPAPPPEYLLTGYWSGKALAAATQRHRINVAWSGKDDGFRILPRMADLALSADAPYFHYISNETVEGIQFQEIMGRDDVPRVCDMSSDFLSRPCEAARYSLLYAHAQKNLGPAGVTVVVVRDEMLGKLPADLPEFLDYRIHATAHSNYNTPPVFAIYAVMLATRWLTREVGGLDEMGAINRRKAALLYQAIDDSEGYYKGRADAGHRSTMNVAFNMATPELERRFLQASSEAGFSGLNGHRAIGGMRASLYNGVTIEAAEALVGFMHDFRKRHAA
ncbi:MAG TPA: phosphoserine transaminase [Bordetella sp.]